MNYSRYDLIELIFDVLREIGKQNPTYAEEKRKSIVGKPLKELILLLEEVVNYLLDYKTKQAASQKIQKASWY